MVHGSMARLGCLLLLAPGLSAQRGSAQQVAGVAVRDSAGVRIVEMAGAVLEGLPVWRIAEQPSLQLGSPDPAAPEFFGTVGRAAALPDGSLAVGDRNAHDIRVFDPVGRVLRTIGGGSGDGPGVIQGDPWIHFAGRDGVVAFDTRLSRITVFDGQGGVVETRPRGTACPFEVCSPRGVMADGTPVFVYEARTEPTAETLGRFVPGGTFEVGVGLPDGTYRRAASGSLPDVYVRSLGSAGAAYPGYQAPPWYRFGTQRFMIAFRDRYEIQLFDASGSLVQIIRVEKPRVPFTEAERRAILGETSTPEGLAQYKPAIGYPLFGDGDDVWVPEFRDPALSAADSPTLWTIFGADGMPVARLQAHPIPDHLLNLSSSRDQLRVHTVDDTGRVHRVLVYPIVKE